jgi:hypothetical protein
MLLSGNVKNFSCYLTKNSTFWLITLAIHTDKSISNSEELTDLKYKEKQPKFCNSAVTLRTENFADIEVAKQLFKRIIYVEVTDFASKYGETSYTYLIKEFLGDKEYHDRFFVAREKKALTKTIGK